MSASAMREGLRTLRDAGDTTTFEGMDPDNLPPFAVEDDDLDAMIDGMEFFEAKMDAMRAHASQIATDGPFFAFSDSRRQSRVGPRVLPPREGHGGAPGGPRARGRPLRRAVITRLGLVLLGAYVALIGAVVHRHQVELLGVDWPWGLALALGATTPWPWRPGTSAGSGSVRPGSRSGGR